MQEPSFRAYSIVPPRRQQKLGNQHPSDARRASTLPPKDITFSMPLSSSMPIFTCQLRGRGARDSTWQTPANQCLGTAPLRRSVQVQLASKFCPGTCSLHVSLVRQSSQPAGAHSVLTSSAARQKQHIGRLSCTNCSRKEADTEVQIDDEDEHGSRE